MADYSSSAGIFASVVFGAFTLRYLSFLSGVNDWTYDRIEFSTPVVSWKRVLEGLSLLDYGVSPYSGDTVHEPPLILLLFHLLKSQDKFLIPVLFIICDVVTGFVLYKIAQLHCYSLMYRQKSCLSHYAEDVEPILLKSDDLKNLPFYVMTRFAWHHWTVKVFILGIVILVFSYLFNPFTVGTCLAESTGIFSNLSVALALYYSLLGSAPLSTFFVAFATYKSLYPVILIVPLSLILSQKKSEGDKFSGGKTTSLNIGCISLVIFWFVVWITILIGLSYSLVGSWEFLDATYGFILRVPDLTPNMGLFWYLFLEMFDHFREFFILVFQLNAFFYILPLSSLLRNEPVFLFYTITSVMAVFKSYPAFGDFSIPFALLVSWSHLYPYMKNVFVVGCMLLCSSLLAPLFWYLWMYAGSANANFFYAATLAYSTGQIFLLGDVIFAYLRRNFDLEHGTSRRVIDGEKMTVILK